MGKAVLLIISAAVVSSTFITMSRTEVEVDTSDAHRYVQAEQLASDVADAGRTVVLGKMMASGGGGFADASTFWTDVPTGAQPLSGDMSLGHYEVTHYEVDGDEVEFSVTGKHYKDMWKDAAGAEVWEHAVHTITSRYTLKGIPVVPPVDIPKNGSCSTLDLDYADGLRVGGDVHLGDAVRLVRITGGMEIPNNKRYEGAGVLVVEGDLIVEGGLVWDGVVIVHDAEGGSDVTVDLDRADEFTVTGGFVLGDEDLQDVLDTIPNENADGSAIAGLLNSLGDDGSYDISANDEFALVYDKEAIFEAAKCMGVASHVLELKSQDVQRHEDEEDDGHVCRNNNGHGNNADGVDSSNPGQGGGGPNGETDASCTGDGECVDDENRP